MNPTVYGPKYDKDITTTEIAKRVRADIKAAVKTGTLPKGIKVSVRTDYFSGGSSIDARITTFPGTVIKPEVIGPNGKIDWNAVELNRFGDEPGIYTKPVREAVALIEAILSDYNFDGSDSMTDYFHVRFYSHVNVDYRLDTPAARVAA